MAGKSGTYLSGYGLNFAEVSQDEDGAKDVIAAVEGKKIVVLGYALTANLEGKIVLKDSSATRGTLHLAKGSPATYSGGPFAPAFECAEGKALQIENPAGVDTFGHLVYVLA